MYFSYENLASCTCHVPFGVQVYPGTCNAHTPYERSAAHISKVITHLRKTSLAVKFPRLRTHTTYVASFYHVTKTSRSRLVGDMWAVIVFHCVVNGTCRTHHETIAKALKRFLRSKNKSFGASFHIPPKRRSPG